MKLNEFISVSDNQTVNYNKDIVITDLDGGQKIVVRCYCTIVALQSISYYMDVLEKDIFARFKDVIQPEIEKFKEEARALAIENGVPII